MPITCPMCYTFLSFVTIIFKNVIHTSKLMQLVKLYVLHHIKIFTLMLDEEYIL
jgi:hypothetical protein